MRKNKGFVLRRLGSDAMIVAESPDLIDFDRLISLNTSAAYVWQSLSSSEFEADTIVRLLTSKYDVDEATARADAEELIKIWLEAGIITE